MLIDVDRQPQEGQELFALEQIAHRDRLDGASVDRELGLVEAAALVAPGDEQQPRADGSIGHRAGQAAFGDEPAHAALGPHVDDHLPRGAVGLEHPLQLRLGVDRRPDEPRSHQRLAHQPRGRGRELLDALDMLQQGGQPHEEHARLATPGQPAPHRVLAAGRGGVEPLRRSLEAGGLVGGVALGEALAALGGGLVAVR